MLSTLNIWMGFTHVVMSIYKRQHEQSPTRHLIWPAKKKSLDQTQVRTLYTFISVNRPSSKTDYHLMPFHQHNSSL